MWCIVLVINICLKSKYTECVTLQVGKGPIFLRNTAYRSHARGVEMCLQSPVAFHFLHAMTPADVYMDNLYNITKLTLKYILK